MKITVIASTYNAEEWLEKVLLGYRCQTWRDFELIVADDGSRESTRALVERFAADYPVPLRHVWHEDEGYRRQEILNVAILEARHDYLLFTDGDCIPRRDFVQVMVFSSGTTAPCPSSTRFGRRRAKPSPRCARSESLSG